MRPALFVLAVLWLFSAAIDGQQEKAKPRVIFSPVHFYSPEKFLELNEADRTIYVMGLMDGFYTSAFFGAPDEAVAKLTSCAKDMDSKQISAIITKYVKEHPEHWHLSLSAEAYSALNAACPGGLTVK